MNQNPYTRKQFYKDLISGLVVAGLIAACVSAKAQTVPTPKLTDTIQWSSMSSWLSIGTVQNSIEMSLPDSTITIQGDTLEVIKEMFNQFSEMSNRLRIEIELNDKYRKAWDDYMNALKNYKKHLRIVKNHKI